MSRWVVVCAAVFFASCVMDSSVEPAQKTDVPVLTADELRFLAERNQPVKYGQAELDGIVDDAIDLLDGDIATRSADGRSVLGITPVSSDIASTTRSGETASEEVLYVVNYAGDEGYSVVAADRRLPDQILISVGSGNLDIEEEIDNPGLALMLVGAEEYVRREIAEYEAWADSMEVVMAAKIAPETRANGIPPASAVIIERRVIHEGPLVTAQKIAPMITTEWGQGDHAGSPYNSFVESEEFSDSYIASLHANYDYIPAGCVAVASAQLMAYWKFPNSYSGWGGYTYSDNLWNKLRQYKSVLSADSDTQMKCGLLLWMIGNNVDMEYNPASDDGSGAKSQDAINMLKGMGYSASSLQDYNYSGLKSSLTAGRPVYMRGYSEKTSFLGIPTYDGGHAWLTDGYLKQTRTVDYEYVWAEDLFSTETWTTYGTVTHNYEFFHNNWGWEGSNIHGGDGNGYYIAGIFEGSRGPDLPSETRAGDGNFVYNLEMWTNIYPN